MPTVKTTNNGKDERQSWKATVTLERTKGQDIKLRGFGSTERAAVREAERKVRDFEKRIYEEALQSVSKLNEKLV